MGGAAKVLAKPGKLPLLASSRETLVKYWGDVGLQVDILPNYVNNALCYSSGNAFIQCMAALNVLVTAHSKKNLAILPAANYFEAPQNITIVQNNGLVVIASWEPSAREPKDKLKEMHAFETATRKAWMKMVNSGQRLDVDKLLASLSKKLGGNPEEAFIVASAINEFMQVNDAHARIMPEELLKKNHDSDVVDNLVGIGVVIGEQEGAMYIDGVMEGGPAELSGLKTGDVIVSVDGKLVGGDLRKGVSGMKGLENTKVTVTVKRGVTNLNFDLVRKKVEVKNVSTKFVENGTTKLGTIRLNSFIPENSPGQIAQAVKDFEAKGAQAIVLDLRGNPGGSLHIAVEIAALFLGGDKKVVTSKSLYPQAIPDKTYMTDAAARAITGLPLVVLVDPMSASASELLAGALQDHKRAWIVGERSFGKGTVQAGLKPLGVHKVLQPMPIVVFETIARFYLPSGRTNQLVGVVPDFIAERRPGEKINYPREEDLYPNALSSVGEAAHSERAEDIVKQLRACVETTGKAKAGYDAANSTLPRDYPLHVVLDLMACFEHLKIQPMAMAMLFD